MKILEKNASNPDLREKNFKDLAAIEKRVAHMKVARLDAKELYDLKAHVGDTRQRLNLME